MSLNAQVVLPHNRKSRRKCNVNELQRQGPESSGQLLKLFCKLAKIPAAGQHAGLIQLSITFS